MPLWTVRSQFLHLVNNDRVFKFNGPGDHNIASVTSSPLRKMKIPEVAGYVASDGGTDT